MPHQVKEIKRLRRKMLLIIQPSANLFAKYHKVMEPHRCHRHKAKLPASNTKRDLLKTWMEMKKASG